MPDTTVILWYYVEGEPGIFPIAISTSTFIAVLKKIIKGNNNCFQGVEYAEDLVLWKVR